MINSPCKDCKDRTLKCHATCDKYKSYKNKVEKAKQKQMEIRINRSAIFRPNIQKKSK